MTQPITNPARLLRAKYDPSIKCASHLIRPLDPTTRRDTIEKIIEVLKRYDFDAIAFRGLSGALVAPTVAMLMDKTLLAVRKGERCHSSHTVEGDYNAQRYVILDDMISSGDTVKDIFHAIEGLCPKRIA
jgi:adenine/guanine phosphoribosyltransferase-like PRPP-binding protein